MQPDGRIQPAQGGLARGIRVVIDLGDPLANLAAKEGSTLERNNINIELK